MKWAFATDDLPADQIRQAFRVFGFVLIRGVLGRGEVAQVRAELDQAFDDESLRQLPIMSPTQLLKHEQIWSCVLKDAVVHSLRSALGPELCYQQDLEVQRNSFGQGGAYPHRGWHMDAGSETAHAYLRDPDYRFAKCGIFLQDFDNAWGGGIRVKPKSHRRYFEANPLKRNLFYLRTACDLAAIKLRMEVDTISVPTRAGDLCFFDSRLLHSSVLPTQSNIRRIGYHRRGEFGLFWADVPRAHTKYIIYWDACNAAMSADFLRNSVARSELEKSDMREEPCRPATFSRILSVHYPDDFPAGFVATAEARGVAMASLAPDQAARYKRKLQSMQLLHP